MAAPATPAPARPLWLAVEVVAAALLLGALGWQVRGVLSPILLFPLLCAVLWPHRGVPGVSRLLVTMGTLTAVWFLWSTGTMLAPFILALVIAYFLAPAVDALCTRGVPRGGAIALVLLPFLAGLALFLILLIPTVQHQLVGLASELPILIRRIVDWLLRMRTGFLARSGGLLTDEQAAALANLQASDLVGVVSAEWSGVARRVWSTLMGVGRGLSVVFGIVMYFVVTPVVTYYILKSWSGFTRKLEELIPPQHRESVIGFVGEYDTLLGRYLRGQLLEAGIVGSLTGLTLWLLGFPGALLVGVIAGIGNLVPYVGLPVSLIPGVLFALVSPMPWANLAKLGAVFFVVQFIDNTVTGPRIVGQSVGLNPVWVMIALVLFGSVLGFVGLLVAVPLAVLVKLLMERALVRYKASNVYQEAGA